MSRPVKLDDPILHEIIESIVMLTEQRDQRSLEQSLFSSLQEMLEPDACWLIKLEAEEQSEPVDIVAGKSGGLNAELIQAFRSIQPQEEFRVLKLQGKDYLLAPTLRKDDNQTRLLVLAQDAWDENNLRLVQGMFKVYQNFIALLQDSEKDTLTGLFNRRKLEGKLNDLLMAALMGRRYTDQSHSDFLAVLDIDKFKQVNDTYGHLIGDETLLVFSNVLRNTLRDNDLIYRYGGEEFIILLQDITSQQAEMVLERVRRNVDNQNFPQVGHITVSIGFTTMSPGLTPTQVIEQADRALYFAKENGRNQTSQYQQLVDSGKLQPHTESGSVDLF